MSCTEDHFNSLSNILTPIAISFFIWFLINGLANEIKKIPYINKRVLDFVATPLSLIIILYSIVKIRTFVTSSMIELGSVVAQLDSKINVVIDKVSTLTSFDLKEPLQKFFQEFNMATLLNKIFIAFSSILSNTMQIFLYVLFLLIDQRFFDLKLNALFQNENSKNKAKHILTSISKGVRTYILITTIVSLITGFFNFLNMSIFWFTRCSFMGIYSIYFKFYSNNWNYNSCFNSNSFCYYPTNRS